MDKLQLNDSIYKFNFNIDSTKFIKLINDLSLVEGQIVNIIPLDKSIEWYSEGDLGKTKINLEYNNIQTIDNLNILSLQSKFSLPFLKKFLKGSLITKNEINISMANGFPIKFLKTFDEDSYLKFYIAPKIE